MATTKEPRTKQGKRLLARKDDAGAHALLDALQRAPRPQAFGAHYIDNILSQALPPQRQQPPVRRKQPPLHQIRLADPALAAYEALVITRTRV